MVLLAPDGLLDHITLIAGYRSDCRQLDLMGTSCFITTFRAQQFIASSALCGFNSRGREDLLHVNWKMLEHARSVVCRGEITNMEFPGSGFTYCTSD